jgi:hypothetical protein
LRVDIGETRDLADSRPEDVQRLFSLAEKFRDELGDSLTKRVGKGTREPGRVANPKAKSE